ncbi:uncharacterized protein METZ01_LOCUS479766, partial [marine metagenome]
RQTRSIAARHGCLCSPRGLRRRMPRFRSSPSQGKPHSRGRSTNPHRFTHLRLSPPRRGPLSPLGASSHRRTRNLRAVRLACRNL